MDIFSKRLKECRENKNLSQEELAHKLEMPVSEYKKLEEGYHPTFTQFVEISDTLEVSTDYLIGR